MQRSRILAASIAVVAFSSSEQSCAAAAPDGASLSEPAVNLHEVTVTASPLAAPGEELIQPSAVLFGAELDDRRGNTVGETVNQIPGVQSSYFGAGVGRPIIRGLEGTRVQVLESGVRYRGNANAGARPASKRSVRALLRTSEDGGAQA